MTFSVSVKSDVDRVLRDTVQVERRLVKRAAALALNQIINSAKSRAAKRMTGATGVKVTAYRKRMKVTRAKAGKLTVAIWAGLLKITAKDLGKPKQNASGSKAGKYTFPGAFVARLRPGSPANVFKRKGPARHPVESQGVEIGPRLDRMLLHEINIVQANKWDRVFNQKLAYLLKR